MKVRTISSLGREHQLSDLHWDCVFHGSPIDERSRAAIDFSVSASTKQLSSEFSITQPDRLVISGNLFQRSEIKGKMLAIKANSLLFEATSLGTVEILFLLRAAKEAGLKSVDCLYVEPLEYAKGRRIDMSWSREYSLSSSSPIQGVRGFLRPNAIPSQDGKFVAFLGYEGARLARACDDDESLLAWRKHAIFGVPGYAPGWDMNAMANNIDCLSRNEFQTIRYCSASSVSNAYELLTEIHMEGRNDSTHTVVAPLGTKPHGIATAMFLVDQSAYQASSLLYDHPERSPNRSTQVRRWHLYRIDLTDSKG